MKFIANKNAPNFPLKLIEAQEDEKLVFFCGAGISYPAGLPGFSGLVDKVYEGLAEIKRPLEEQAIKEKLYDRALGILEQRVHGNQANGENLVRKQIIKQLQVKKGANLNTHEAILQLAKTENGRYRLVTTNVDKAFSIASQLSNQDIDAAPTLPVPKPHKWASIVHLHGAIDEVKDPNGDHLVFTSGDFGSAYLTERWASKFVTDLFMNFTVVFVGYSINDPVIRYMTDAIAAERRFSNERFQLPYVIADTGESSFEVAELEWLAKGVQPVLYKADDKAHSHLHNSLIAWSEYCRDGLNSKLRIIKSSARITPQVSYDQDEGIQRIVDIISEKINKNDPTIDGYYAKVFSNLNNPPAPVEWLKVFDSKGLLSVAKIKYSVTPVADNISISNSIEPNKVTYHLWLWLLHHLETKDLVHWAIDKGADLDPYLKKLIKLKIEQSEIKHPYSKFWKVLVSTKIKRKKISNRGAYKLIDNANTGDYLALSEFKKKVTPFYEVSKNTFNDWYDTGEDGVKEPYIFDVSISMDKYEYRKIRDMPGYPDQYIPLLELISNSLLESMQLLEFVKQADEYYDHSNWIMVSIEEHTQNSYYRNISILIALCRDLWISQYNECPSKARALLKIWSYYKYPVFRRLIMHAYTKTDVVSPEDALDYLLEHDAWWLWSTSTNRETFRLLKKIWPKINNDSAIVLLMEVVKGPPRDMYKSSLPDNKFENIKDRDRWVMLAKLESYGRNLLSDAQQLYIQLCRKYPKWQLRSGDRDEFTHWHTSSSGYDIDITQEDFFALPVHDRITRLQKEGRYKEGYLNLFKVSGQEYAKDIIITLRSMYRRKIWCYRLWQTGLYALANSKEDSWIELSWIVFKLPEHIYQSEGHTIAYWIRKSFVKVTASPQTDARLIAISQRILDTIDVETIELDEHCDVMSLVVDNPIGMITESILDSLSRFDFQVNETFSDIEQIKFLESILGNKKLIIGQLSIISRLAYLFSIDPAWVKSKILQLLFIPENRHAKLFWEAYLWNPRITADLAIEIKILILEVINTNLLKDSSLEELANLFCYMCIEYTNIFTNDEKRSALRSFSKEGLAYISDYLYRSYSEVELEKSKYYKHRIHPFLRECWPKGVEYTSEDSSENLALLALEYEGIFDQVWEDMNSLLTQVTQHSFIMDRLIETKIPEIFPSLGFKLMEKVFNEKNLYNLGKVKILLDRLKLADPDIQSNIKFQRMNEIVIRNTN